MLNDHPIYLDLRIDWSEVDSFGHVNNLAIMRYIQSTRVHCLEGLGMMQHHSEHGMAPVLASASCQFKKQLHYPGTVSVHAKVDHLKTTSFQVNHVVLNEAGEVIAEAHDVLVMFDFNKNSKCPIPLPFREKILALGASSAL